MRTFIRAYEPGGTFFFTVVTYGRRPLFRDPTARGLLRQAIDRAQAVRPFQMPAVVLLPDHVRCLWTLAPDDYDFSTRWRKIKEDFTRAYRAAGRESAVTAAQRRKGQRGIWQPRFWEHTIRDERAFVIAGIESRST